MGEPTGSALPIAQPADVQPGREAGGGIALPAGAPAQQGGEPDQPGTGGDADEETGGAAHHHGRQQRQGERKKTS